MDIEDLIDRVVEGGREGLRELAERILETSNNNIGVGDPELDPNLAISLREAGKVVEEGNGFIIVYDTAYAAKQHEALDFQTPSRRRTEVSGTFVDRTHARPRRSSCFARQGQHVGRV
jgi:hypothetical protein